MRKIRFTGLMFAVCVMLAATASAGGGGGGDSEISGISTKISSIVCPMVSVLVTVSSAVAALVFVVAGIKWTSSEADPGARKQAKDAMIHAIIGLIIIQVVEQSSNSPQFFIFTQPSRQTPHHRFGGQHMLPQVLVRNLLMKYLQRFISCHRQSSSLKFP